MAYAYGTTTVNGYWKSYLKYSISSTATTYSVTCVVGMYNLRSYTSYDVSGYLKGTGQTTYTATSSNIGGDAGYHALISSKTYTWSKGTSSASKTITFQHKVESGTIAPGTSTGTLSVTVPALASYTVKYNANGGSGAPSSQTKYYGKTLTLSSTKPTRTGYTFQKWNTNSNGTGTSYSSGASYTANSAATLYAVWKANTYTITYNANGGTSGSVTSQTKTYGVTMTISKNATPTRANYTFLGWSTSSSATSATYSAGGSFTTNANTPLYAVWQLAYTSPTISSARCYRVDAPALTTDTAIDSSKTYYERSGSGTSASPYTYSEVESPDVSDIGTYYEIDTTSSDEGTYLYVSFNYTTGYKNSAYQASSLKITVTGNTTASTYTDTLTAGSGSWNALDDYSMSSLLEILDADTSYTVKIEIYDSGYTDHEASKTVKVPTATYPVDLNIGTDGNVVMGVMSPAVDGQPLTLPASVYFGDHTSAIGTAKNSYPSSAVRATSGTAVNVCSIDLEAGIWVVNCGVRFPANATGIRRANLSTTSTAEGADIQWSASSAGVTQLNFTQIVGPTLTTTYYLNAYQNSGSELSLPAGSSGSINYIRAVRII